MVRKLVHFALVLLSLVIVSPRSVAYATPAQATTYDVLNLRTQLDAAQRLLIRNGYTIREARWDTLALGDNAQFAGTLRKGYSYRILAIGGRGIADLDITLYDENDNVIDEDSSTDALPVVDVRPRWSGPFTLDIELYAIKRGVSLYDDYVYGYIVAYK